MILRIDLSLVCRDKFKDASVLTQLPRKPERVKVDIDYGKIDIKWVLFRVGQSYHFREVSRNETGH